jgi:type VI secretion system protein ImpG
MNDVLQVELRPGTGAGTSPPIVLPAGALRPVGFEPDESVLPHSERSFAGYRLVQEYFAFPEKYLFFDVTGLDRLVVASFPQSFDLVFSLRREFSLEKGISTQTFRLHCTPIVNLFSHVAEPIRVTHLQTEYRVVPDVGRPMAMEVYSIDEVSATRPDLEKPIVYEPFYSVRHATSGEEATTFWNASRRSSERKDDDGTEVFLTLVDLGFRPSVPDVETLTVRAICSNRDLPGRLPFGSSTGGADFELEGAGVFTAIRCLRKPTASLRTPLRRGTQWRLISHLSLNHLSLVEGAGGPQALQEILKLYDFADSSATRQQIEGITRLSARRTLRPVGSAAAGFVRGIEVSAEFDETQFIGTGVFLFAAVLERFLALYSSVNSFSQLVASTRQREGLLKRWPPRAGEQIVL